MRAYVFFAIFSAIIAVAALADTFPECYTSSQKYDGGVLGSQSVADAEECQTMCQNNGACGHFTVTSPGGVCTLHGTGAVASTADGHVSGPAMRTGTDIAASARCKQVRCGYEPGLLDCPPRQNKCVTASGIVWGGANAISKCLASFGDPFGYATTACPDGGIGPRGVADTSLGDGTAVCNAYDADRAARGISSCDATGNLCTKMAAAHGNMMSKSAGYFVMKRMSCSSGTCNVFKAGKCFDVGENIFSKKNLLHIGAADLETQNKAFAAKVIEGLMAGLPMACNDADALKAAGLIKFS